MSGTGRGDLVRLRCGDLPYAVHLVLPATLHEAARALLEPYVRVETVTADQARWWQVRTTTPMDDGLDEHQLTTVRGTGEPPMRLWSHPGRRELVVDDGLPGPLVVQYLVRYVRVLLRVGHSRGEELFLHGGMVSGDDQGVVILGGKGAGKTSSIVACLTAGLDFVANDDVSLVGTEDGWAGRGWPRAVSVRQETLAALDIDLDSQVLSHPAHRVAIRDAGAEAILHPSELTGLTNRRPPRARALVRALVFPVFAASPSEKVRLVPLETAAALRGLTENTVPVLLRNERFLAPCFPPEPSTAALCSRVADEIPAYLLVQRFSALRESADMIRGLLSDPATTIPSRSIG
ncbi:MULTISPECIES: hypothetical protein [Streptomyces]|uniref:Serine kinase n=1 Tax=Streptomyces caniscabiei TaxID=2746961 RepID=A0ABU4MZ03_9ACTN|nr:MULTISPECIES: hypothetical protein [Streptomyces]MBE4741310.1 hypothetical protein [Streptomyces caniscabiei]MBE4760961.1 hypothetical protein [Streptomyces caniscabiei]MBE4774882.1 hypothetical protein [Streptomyces caniscabiei]MBE4789640.1 hypothetical protein [Streptomyces caniscabiei]MBE4798823.1 hypothetical protein [Streptomyces caniscabiei]